jgi:hypothetical protein
VSKAVCGAGKELQRIVLDHLQVHYLHDKQLITLYFPFVITDIGVLSDSFLLVFKQSYELSWLANLASWIKLK